MLEIRKTRTTSYNPRCNGQPERFNQTLVQMIKAFIEDDQLTWDLHLGCLAGAYRATINESTGFTPNMLMLGREVRMPIELCYSIPDDADDFLPDYCQYVSDLQTNLQMSHDLARQHLKQKTKRQKEIYDAKSTLLKFEIGDLVWYASGSSQLDIAPKLRRKFIGPMVIVKKLSALTYTIQTDAKGTQKIVHHNKLRHYIGNKKPKWAMKVAKLNKHV